MSKPTIAQEQIVRTYNGRPGCACGCRGTYKESAAAKAAALRSLAKAQDDKVEEIDCHDGTICAFWDSEDGQRTYSIYYRKAEVA